MKFTRMVKETIEVDTLRISIPMRYGSEDAPFDLPFRVGPHVERGKYDIWTVDVDLATGRIKGWPGPAFDLYTKVCDEGVYTLLADGKEIAKIDGYVPECVPGEDGDYVSMKIAADGTVTNWPKQIDLSDFAKDAD